MATLPLSEQEHDEAPVSTAAGRLSLRGRFDASVRTHATDIVILVALVALTILVRVLMLDGIDTGGDAVEKWQFVRQWFYANDFRHAQWNHHMARVGVNAVAGLSQLLFGRGPGAYYVPPIFAATVESCFAYACGKRLESRLTGVLAALFLIYFGAQVRAGSQVMPEIFSGTYGIITAYVFLRYADAPRERRTPWLVGMGVAAFVAYLAKETSVFFFPGFALAILLVGGRLRDVFVFGGVFAAGVACESLAYTIFTDYTNRLQIVVGTHVAEGHDERRLWQLFERFPNLDEAWKFAFYMTLPSCLGLVAFRRDSRVNAFVAMEASYVFFLTFLVRKVWPVLMIWQNFWARYFDPTAPFVAVIIALFTVICLRRIVEGRPEGERWSARLAPRPAGAAAWAAGTCAVAGLVTYLAYRPHLDENAIAVNAKIAAVANDTYRRNLPLVAAKDVRGLFALYNVFIDDRLLARKGKLPLYDDVVSRWGGHRVLVKNPDDYHDDLFRRLRSAHCYIEVATQGGRSGLPIKMTPLAKLPPECDDELRR